MLSVGHRRPSIVLFHGVGDGTDTSAGSDAAAVKCEPVKEVDLSEARKTEPRNQKAEMNCSEFHRVYANSSALFALPC